MKKTVETMKQNLDEIKRQSAKRMIAYQKQAEQAVNRQRKNHRTNRRG